MTISVNSAAGAKGNEANFVTDSSGNVVGLAAPDGSVAASFRTLGYHFHGWAPGQGNRDAKFYDRSGQLNDGAFGANLTAATAWGTAGFVATTNPASTDTAIRIPSLGFDYLGGESLLLFWKGQVTPEGSDATLIGDTYSTAANGFRIVCTSTGKIKVNLYQASGTLSRFGGTTAGTVAATGETHSFALAIDGTTGKHKFWVDGAADANFSLGNGFLTLGSGGIIDTTNAVTINIGTGASGSTTDGMATLTQALIILRGRTGLGCPSDIDTLVANMQRDPTRIITAAEW